MAAEKPGSQRDLSAMLLPIADELLVVPRETVLDIIKPRALTRHPSAPEWLTGEFDWHNERLFIVSFESLNGDTPDDQRIASRLVILRRSSSSQDGGPSSYGLLTHGVPHLIRLTPDSIARVDNAVLGPAERMKVRVHGQEGAIPDLDYLDRHVLAYAHKRAIDAPLEAEVSG
jgi:chemosensory pili system protein ChpC